MEECAGASWKAELGRLPVEGRNVQSHCPEGLESAKYFGIPKTLGMRDAVVGKEMRDKPELGHGEVRQETLFCQH